MASSSFEEVLEEVRGRLAGFRALALVNLDGSVTEQAIAHGAIDEDVLSEFATLLRIARHTSADTAAGGLLETSWTTEECYVAARHVSSENFLILVGDPDVRTGFVRYLLRRAAWRLRPQLENASL